MRSAHGGSLRYEENLSNSKLICYSESGEPTRLLFEYKFVGHPWKTSKIIPNCTFIFIFWSSHCVVLFLLRAPASGMSAKYIRRLFKVWNNWPNPKLICYSQRGEPRLLLEYIFVVHSWNLLKLYPIVHSYFFFFSLHCIVLFPLRAPASWRSAKCTLRLFKVWKNWPNSKLICYSGRGEPTRLSFEYKFVGHSLKIYKILPNRRFIFIFCLHTVLYCFHWEHQQVEGEQSAHWGSLRYEGIGQILNW